MTNNIRVKWPIAQVALRANAQGPSSGVAPTNSRKFISGPLASGVDQVGELWEVPHGLQSIGSTTTFNLQEVFELGQVEVYEQSERQPDIEFTLSKALDGSKPLFFMVTDSTQRNNILGQTIRFRVDLTLQIYPDTQFRATGRPVAICTGSGLFVSQIGYTFPADNFCTEDVTLIGNDKIWGVTQAVSGVVAGNGGTDPVLIWPDQANGSSDEAPRGMPSGIFGHDGLTSPLVEGGAQELAGGVDRFGVIIVGSGIQRREDVDIRRSVLPLDVPGIVPFNASGIDAAFVNGGFGAQGPGTAANATQVIGNANTDNIVEHIQSITISISIARDDIFELGSLRPFIKDPTLPLEATCAIEVITSQGSLVDATTAHDQGPDNTSPNNTIILRTVDGLQVDMGDSCRLTNVEDGAIEAGGGAQTVTYNYQAFNTLNVSHDFYQPNHRVLVFETGNSRFNIGAPRFTRSIFGIF